MEGKNSEQIAGDKYTDVTLRVKNLPEEDAEFLLITLMKYLAEKGFEGNVEIVTKTEQELIREVEEKEYDKNDEDLRMYG